MTPAEREYRLARLAEVIRNLGPMSECRHKRTGRDCPYCRECEGAK